MIESVFPEDLSVPAEDVVALLQRVVARHMLRMDRLLFMVRRITLMAMEEMIPELKDKLPLLLEAEKVSFYLFDIDSGKTPNPLSQGGEDISLAEFPQKMRGDEWIAPMDNLRNTLFIGRERICIAGDLETWTPASFAEGIIAIPSNEAGDEGVISFPLSANKTLFGFMTISREQCGFHPDEIEWIELVAEFVSLSLYNRIQFIKLREFSIKDGLTGLYNHQFFYDALLREVKRAQRYESELAIIMIDLDNFKAINDSHGHIIGDLALSRISKILQSSLRTHDIVARYGGDEFALILPETDKEGALKTARRLQRIITDRCVSFKGHILNLTVSIGVATLSSLSVTSHMELVDKADKAMYLAKKAGKNRITFLSDTV